MSANLILQIVTYRHTVDRHEEKFLRLDHVEQKFEIEENVLENLFLCDTKVYVVVVGMRAVVDDAVHVEIQVVELGHLQVAVVTS